MKPNIKLTSAFLACMIAIPVLAQQETDDIYFNSKDRAKLNEEKAVAELTKFRKAEELDATNSTINPTDSYSARNINPEYLTQGGNVENPEGSDDYFLPNYQPSSVNQNLNNSSNFNNPYYSNSFYNPYYGYGYNNFNSWCPSYWGNPYSSFNQGWAMSMGYGWGGWNPGWYGSLGYGWGNFWNPWNSWGNYYGYYPSVIIINHEGSRVAYGKRPTRSSNLNHEVDRTRTSTAYTGYERSDRLNQSGRTRTESPTYYERGWKRNSNVNTRSYWNNANSNSNGNTRSVTPNWGNNNNTGRTRSTFSSPSPSRSSFSGTSGGSRSSGGTRSSSSGGTRGRNN